MATISEKFHLKGDAHVTVRVDIGNGQIGGYHAILGSKALAPVSEDAAHVEYDLGPGPGLQYEQLLLTVIVAAANAAADEALVTVTVRQGKKQSVYTEREDVVAGQSVGCGVALSFE